jgi:hypothetical protein
MCFPFNYTVTGNPNRKQKSRWLKVSLVSKGVVNMIDKKSLAFYVFLVAGIVLWLMTDNAVLIILWIVISGAYKRKALDFTNI